MPMGRRWLRSWEGGRVAAGHHGTEIYVLRRRVRGVAYDLTLPAATPRAAILALAEFEADPEGFKGRLTAPPPAAVVLSPELIARYLAWLKKLGRSRGYRVNARHYLGKWAGALGSRDLASVRLSDLKAMLAKWGTAERHRIIVLKSFCAWLREEAVLLSAEQDPTRDLRVPQARPEKLLKPKGVALEHVEKVYACIAFQDVRDVLCLRAKTGLHETEVARLAAGECELRPVENSEIAGVVRLVHKSGRIHVQSLDGQAYAAALRIREHGLKRLAEMKEKPTGRRAHALDNWRQIREIRKAAELAGVPAFPPGELRHSFTTWARTVGREVRATGFGVPLALVAEVIGHQSSRTTSRFYDGTEIPPMIALPLKLVHPDDPQSTGSA